jgi:N-acetylmuramoyl-L-alanine amidase
MDLRARHTRDTSLRARAALVQGAGKTLRLLDNPMRSANFAVLRAPDVPSVLVETGFLSNREDEAVLRDQRQRRRVAEVLASELRTLLTSGLFA